MTVLMDIDGLTTNHSMRLGPKRPPVRVLDGVSFQILQGEVLAVVGESGCGKSTLGRLLLRLIEPTSGTVTFEGQNMSVMAPEQVRQLRQQMVFQDPFGSLSPRRTIANIIAEPLDTFGLAGTPMEKRDAAT